MKKKEVGLLIEVPLSALSLMQKFTYFTTGTSKVYGEKSLERDDFLNNGFKEVKIKELITRQGYVDVCDVHETKGMFTLKSIGGVYYDGEENKALEDLKENVIKHHKYSTNNQDNVDSLFEELRNLKVDKIPLNSSILILFENEPSHEDIDTIKSRAKQFEARYPIFKVINYVPYSREIEEFIGDPI